MSRSRSSATPNIPAELSSEFDVPGELSSEFDVPSELSREFDVPVELSSELDASTMYYWKAKNKVEKHLEKYLLKPHTAILPHRERITSGTYKYEKTERGHLISGCMTLTSQIGFENDMTYSALFHLQKPHELICVILDRVVIFSNPDLYDQVIGN